MSIEYVPILKAMQGEFNALCNLDRRTRERIIPLFDIPMPRNRHRIQMLEKGLPVNQEYLSAIIKKIKKFDVQDAPVMIDMFYWSADAVIENSSQHAFSYVCKELENNFNTNDLFGTRVIPVIDLNKWSDDSYQNALQEIRSMPLPFNMQSREFCIRIDALDSEGFIDQSILEEVLAKLNVNTVHCSVIIDFMDISKKEINDFRGIAFNLMKTIDSYGFKRVIISGNSLPKSITSMVSNKNSSDFVFRKEMSLWKDLTLKYANIIFGDYGTRNPQPEPEADLEEHKEPYFGNRNAQIRYTTGSNYYVVRGCSLQEGGGGQEKNLSHIISNSEYYQGDGFSWGDKQILHCSKGVFTGNASTWIGIETNHHITSVVNEIIEYKQLRRVVAPQYAILNVVSS